MIRGAQAAERDAALVKGGNLSSCSLEVGLGTVPRRAIGRTNLTSPWDDRSGLDPRQDGSHNETRQLAKQHVKELVGLTHHNANRASSLLGGQWW